MDAVKIQRVITEPHSGKPGTHLYYQAPDVLTRKSGTDSINLGEVRHSCHKFLRSQGAMRNDFRFGRNDHE